MRVLGWAEGRGRQRGLSAVRSVAPIASGAAGTGRQWMWASGHSATTVKRAGHGYEPT
jgi:hypothetical protein